MNALRLKLTNEFEIVLQIVQTALRIGHVPRVTNRGLHDPPRLAHRIDPQPHILDVIQRIEHPKDVHPSLLGQPAKFEYDVVRVRRVPHGIGTPQQHLEGNVRHRLPKRRESIPGTLVEETHGDVEGRASPAFEGVGVSEGRAGGFGDVEHVDGAESGGEEGLVGVAPGGVGDEESLVLAYGFGECLGSVSVEYLLEGILLLFVVGGYLWYDWIDTRRRIPRSPKTLGRTIHHDLADISQ
mmetsp:Transcript_14603/g.26144  ORF Transcript_14603/g.26144 Transcript_14603/m.26144 type:complete len:240 (-) Transcript_14603:1935-2654(-)